MVSEEVVCTVQRGSGRGEKGGKGLGEPAQRRGLKERKKRERKREKETGQCAVSSQQQRGEKDEIGTIMSGTARTARERERSGTAAI